MEQEVLSAPSELHDYAEETLIEGALRPEAQEKLTIEEAEKLAEGRIFELIDGKLVFKYPEVLPPESSVPLEERDDVTIEEAEELAQGHSFELIDGRMVFKMPDRKHSQIQAVLTAKLFNYFEKKPIGQVLPEFSLRLWPESKKRLPTPDIAVFLNENLHEEEKYATRAPDLAIEIVSDDDRATAVFEKAKMYLEKGSQVVWMVFPTEMRVMIMTPKEWRWESKRLACPELLPGFSLEVAKIFSPPKSKPGELQRVRQRPEKGLLSPKTKRASRRSPSRMKNTPRLSRASTSRLSGP
jgi:Uma2 family endonuclease